MESSNTRKLIRASLMLAMVIVFQVVGRSVPQVNQFLVGPIVNAVLIFTAAICGIQWGIGVGILTPLMAWLVGQLAPAMAPFIPFIMIGNALYVIFFGILYKYIKFGGPLGVTGASLIKFGFLAICASKLLKLISLGIPHKVAINLAKAMSIPQLVTALIGGILALIFINILTKRKLV